MQKLFFFLIFILLFTGNVSAQSNSTTNTAQVGNHFLSISGFIAPFAEVILTTGSIVLGSDTADQNGNFSIPNVLVNTGFSEFCLEAIDVKKTGTSYTCFKIPLVTDDKNITGIFLPPTIALSGNYIRPGSSIFASGYGMPGATIIINFGKGIAPIETIAGSDGFYKVEIKGLPIGKYNVFATSKFEGQDSEKPDRSHELESLPAPVSETIKDNSFVILALLLLIIISILIAIMLRSKRIREKLRRLIKGRKIIIGEGDKKKHMHHEWFLGF